MMNILPKEPRTLTVYKAGAGSGKTFTLSSEYIKKLVVRPNCYRNILAVTFTNKATGEMKMRILSQLYGIWKRLPDSQQYLSKIMRELNMSEEQVAKMCGEALSFILHDYSHFRIETIDTFFQGILRNIARELDLTANLRIELEDNQIEADAVDDMIENLGKNDLVLTWILDYIKQNIDEDKGWNVIGQIKKFGENIFLDAYKAHHDEFEKVYENPKFFTTFVQEVKNIKEKVLNDIKKAGEQFFDEIERNGLDVSDFNRKQQGVWGYFDRMRCGKFSEKDPNSYVKAALDSPDGWLTSSYRKSPRGKQVLEIVESTLYDLLINAEGTRQRSFRALCSADVTLKNMHQLRLLNSIEQAVRTSNAEANRFLLSDTPTLLQALVRDNDAPFIFEKIGTQLDHIMIDEFQDTGIMQWKNFKVLLEECMSRSREGNLIVGDVKQSIYRWRSGDWRLLNDISSQFSNANERVDIKSLQYNYRSCRNIVDFNNALFNEAAQDEANKLEEKTGNEAYKQQLLRAYSDVKQLVVEEKKSEGLVRVNLLPKDEYREQTFQLIEQTIQELTASGVELKDITIIARRNKDIQDIADYFSQEDHRIAIVSDEAFKLDSSVVVNIIVGVMRLLLHPEDNISRSLVIKLYQKYILGKTALSDNDILLHNEEEHTSLPAAFETSRDTLKKKPLYDIVKQICIMFQLDKLSAENAYLCAFYDQLAAFVLDNPADLESFIDEWDNTIHKKAIQANDIDGVRIMTIHKCKGLEFNNVIVPFCDWKIDNSKMIWCSPNVEPYSSLPVIPINYNTKQLKNTIYTDDYYEESFQNSVDSLNLLYVAFTRAAHNLFVIGKRDKTTLCSGVIETALPKVSKELSAEFTADNYEDAKTELSFTYGRLFVPSEQSEKATHNVFMQSAVPITTHQHTYESIATFRQSNESRDFIEGDDDDKQSGYIKRGLVMHKLFSSIKTPQDIENSITELEFAGVLSTLGMNRQSLEKFVKDRISSPKVAEWFSNRWQLFNECSILTRDKATGQTIINRPDRVMTDGNQVVVIDFKFGNPHPEYSLQVRRYMSLLSQMGYKNIRGYLWFVYSNKIEEVL